VIEKEIIEFYYPDSQHVIASKLLSVPKFDTLIEFVAVRCGASFVVM